MGLLGSLIGAAIDRRDGDSGLKGAVIGSLVQRTVAKSLPLGIGLAAGLVVYRHWRKRATPASYPASEATVG